MKNRDAFFYDVETLSDDGFATLGFVSDTTNRSEGFIVRYDCTGQVLWAKTLGNSGAPTNTNAGIVETDNGDIVFSFNLGTGFFRASILCGRINKNGQPIWMKRIGNNTEFGRDIAKTKDGGFIIVGSTGAYGTDNLADDIYMFKLDANGDVLWNKTFGNPNGTYDEAYAVKLDSRENIIVTGRCIADATFQAFILKADQNGNPIQFKTYGYNNQRTNAFDLIVDKEDNYLITGFTTILEFDHSSSENDPFLIKVDSAMNTLFANVYEVSLGSDISTIGEGLSQLDNGDYAIGVSSSAFSTHNINTPNSPNKNALYIIKKNGDLRKAFIYNQHGSQYTRVRKSSFGSVLLSGFSRAYTDKNHSQGLIIKTDNLFLSGCYDIDVTPEVALYKPTWQIADFSYMTKSGTKSVDYFSDSDSTFKAFTLCEEIPLLNPDFEGPAKVCPGNVLFTELSAGPGNKYWIVDNDTIRKSGDLNYKFSTVGTHTVTLVLQFSCIVKSLSKSIEILPAFKDTLRAVICDGQKYVFNGKEYDKEGYYEYVVAGSNGECDSIYTLELKLDTIPDLLVDLGIQNYCDFFEFEGKSYTKEGNYMLVDTLSDCMLKKVFFTLMKDYSIDTTELDTVYYCDKFEYKGIEIDSAGRYDTVIIDTTLDCRINSFNVTLIEKCDCLEFPNVFTPENGDDLNNDFKPFYSCSDKIKIESYSLKVFNRWGIKVFESNNYQLAWDGKYKNEQAPMETYMYVSEYKRRYNPYQSAVFKTKKGTITLIR